MFKKLIALALTAATHGVLRLAHKSRSHATRQRLRTLAGMIRPCRSPRVLAVAITLPLSLPMPVVADMPELPTLAAITVTVPPPVVILEAANWTAQPMPETAPAPTAPKKRGRPRKQPATTATTLTKGK